MKKYSFLLRPNLTITTRFINDWKQNILRTLLSGPQYGSISKELVLWCKKFEFNYLKKPSNPFPQNKTNHSDTTSVSKICSNDVSKQLRHLNHPINIILVSLLLTLSMFYLLRKCNLFKIIKKYVSWSVFKILWNI